MPPIAKKSPPMFVVAPILNTPLVTRTGIVAERADSAACLQRNVPGPSLTSERLPETLSAAVFSNVSFSGTVKRSSPGVPDEESMTENASPIPPPRQGWLKTAYCPSAKGATMSEATRPSDQPRSTAPNIQDFNEIKSHPNEIFQRKKYFQEIISFAELSYFCPLQDS